MYVSTLTTRAALLLLLSGFTTSAAVNPVSYKTIISDILAINTGVNNFRSDLAAYNGGLLKETPLIGDFAEIEAANRKGYADSNLASNFTASQSKAIVKSVTSSVGQSIPAAITELEAKKSLFEKSGQDGLVDSQLEVLLYDHDTLSAALLKKLTADQTAAEAVILKIHDAIQNGVEDFSS